MFKLIHGGAIITNHPSAESTVLQVLQESRPSL